MQDFIIFTSPNNEIPLENVQRTERICFHNLSFPNSISVRDCSCVKIFSVPFIPLATEFIEELSYSNCIAKGVIETTLNREGVLSQQSSIEEN